MGHGASVIILSPLPNSHCPLPIAQCPMPIAQCPIPASRAIATVAWLGFAFEC
ncbi:hypothetical protein [Tolypothrix sp. VBCCA 56010]|uniref:hypothetical protein n=1 Tax=Tolypothrix sp. VBCCA 56010 TaxID=3137731 RepID=UPI003D7DB59B